MGKLFNLFLDSNNLGKSKVNELTISVFGAIKFSSMNCSTKPSPDYAIGFLTRGETIRKW
jgi:hypothetical protein